MINWDKEFERAISETYGGKHPGLCIQNVKPPNGRNIFKDDKDKILASAKKYGFVIIGGTEVKAVSFIKKT